MSNSINKIETVTYFERIEVLYDGEYFNAIGFSDYGNAGKILEKEETKITTQNEEFANKHGFKKTKDNTFEKILALEQFEGLQILKIPSIPHAEVIKLNIPKDKVEEELRKRAKTPSDMISDGVLAYGVNVGRFIFEEEGYTVYVISDFPHIGPSDVFMIYQISKADYDKLLSLSCEHKIPEPPISSEITDNCRKKFLCGSSAYCKSYYCSLDDTFILMAERNIPSKQPQKENKSNVFNYCPNCGKKNEGNKYCRDCGTKLFKS